MKQAIRTLKTLLMSYCAIAFIWWDYNPYKWDSDGRFGMVVMFATILFIKSIWQGEIEIK
jgi:hypothetical protein